MALLAAFKEVAELPVTLKADSFYCVRVSDGFDLYTTTSDAFGAVTARKLNLNSPVTPNLLLDTRRFNKLNDSAVGVEIDILLGAGMPWYSYLKNGTTGSGTYKVVSLANLAAEGCPHGADLDKAIDSGLNGDFNVLILDVTITGNQTDTSAGEFSVLNQLIPSFVGVDKGEFSTQASGFGFVFSQSGATEFYLSDDLGATVKFDSTDTLNQWTYKQNTRLGWGDVQNCYFKGVGSMKIAIALPYIGHGDHKDKFVWAGSVGPYHLMDDTALLTETALMTNSLLIQTNNLDILTNNQ